MRRGGRGDPEPTPSRPPKPPDASSASVQTLDCKPWRCAWLTASAASHAGLLTDDGVLLRSRARATAPATVVARSSNFWARSADPATRRLICAGDSPGGPEDFIEKRYEPSSSPSTKACMPSSVSDLTTVVTADRPAGTWRPNAAPAFRRAPGERSPTPRKTTRLVSEPTAATDWQTSPARPVLATAATTPAASAPRYASRSAVPAPGTVPGGSTGTAITAGAWIAPWATAPRYSPRGCGRPAGVTATWTSIGKAQPVTDLSAAPSLTASSADNSTTSRPPPSSGTRITMPRPSLVTSSGPSPVRGFIAAIPHPLPAWGRLRPRGGLPRRDPGACGGSGHSQPCRSLPLLSRVPAVSGNDQHSLAARWHRLCPTARPAAPAIVLPRGQLRRLADHESQGCGHLTCGSPEGNWPGSCGEPARPLPATACFVDCCLRMAPTAGPDHQGSPPPERKGDARDRQRALGCRRSSGHHHAEPSRGQERAHRRDEDGAARRAAPGGGCRGGSRGHHHRRRAGFLRGPGPEGARRDPRGRRGGDGHCPASLQPHSYDHHHHDQAGDRSRQRDRRRGRRGTGSRLRLPHRGPAGQPADGVCTGGAGGRLRSLVDDTAAGRHRPGDRVADAGGAAGGDPGA